MGAVESRKIGIILGLINPKRSRYSIALCQTCSYPAARRGVAQSGSAPALGAGGREFESRRPDHYSGD